ncbi:myo-inosose-2 dehydratase [Chelatococcus sp. SYSU_G07232]|uniref:Myo-inosose-2 dehydratase n=1 Tax=Chelatococcus albus TaxID=3047466 RepID=A0ABT7AJS4_9HYPH|nr:myo-inosose-2 dehydratase [Chelatococcus sp. SYSU_G07232]MDJ1159069.1 myo-inosose-2 dehydratase [Chelatococcus sp. SYSU_G07232]
MAVRIGANPIGWSNDDMRELGGATPLETCLKEAKEAGFEGMELGHKFPREPEALKAALAPFGLDLVSGWYSAELLRRAPEEEMAALRPHLDLLKAMGCKVLVFAETSNAIHGDRSKPLAARPTLAAGDWAEFGRRVTAVGDAVLAEGLRLVYHHHMGTVVETEADIDAFMAATGPSVHLLLDTGHATFAGADPAVLARRYRTRISHFHAKDVRKEVMERARRERLSFLDAVIAGVYTVPGDGCVDYAAVLGELPGYSGWAVVEAEQDPEKAHPLTYARMGYANLRRYLAEAGLL